MSFACLLASGYTDWGDSLNFIHGDSLSINGAYNLSLLTDVCFVTETVKFQRLLILQITVQFRSTSRIGCSVIKLEHEELIVDRKWELNFTVTKCEDICVSRYSILKTHRTAFADFT